MEIRVVDEIRQPEYTGENRCEPCTVLNVLIGAIASAAIARRSRVLGLLAFGVSLALVYLRGYLVPGTPTLTKRYLPDEVLRWFGKDPDAPVVNSGLGAGTGAASASDTGSGVGRDDGARAAEATAPDGGAGASVEASGPSSDAAAGASAESAADAAQSGSAAADDAEQPESGQGDSEENHPEEIEPETYFLERGLLEVCEDGEDLCLTESFGDAWLDEMEELDDGEVTASAAAESFGFDPGADEYEIEANEDARILLEGDSVVGQWPSRAALVADIAAAQLLEERQDDWHDHSPEQKGRLLNGLRLFLDECPNDGGAVEMTEEVVESCCRSHEVVALVCSETDERLFEQPLVEA